MQTSEFKMSLLAVLAGLAMIALGLFKTNDTLIVSGTGLVTGAVGLYSLSRGKAKKGS